MGNFFCLRSDAPVEGDVVVSSRVYPPQPEQAPQSHRHPAPIREVLFFPDSQNGGNNLARLVSWLRETRSTMDICVFSITHNVLRDAILQAHTRGVKVRVITDDDKANDKGSDIATLQQHGIAVKFDNSPHHMHHKYAILDNSILLNGSFNWTASAVESNNENIMITNQPKLVGDFVSNFNSLWAQFR